MLKNISAVIFDFDGVIVNSERVKFARLGKLLQKKGLCLKKTDFKRMVGMKTGAFLHQRFKGLLTQKQIEEISKARRDDQRLHPQLYAKVVPGVQQLIRKLKKKKVTLCLATGTQREIVNKTLMILGLQKAFSVLVTGEEFKTSKPNSEVYMLAILKLKLQRKSIVVIEDSAAGVAAAKKMGLFCIAITTTQTRKELKQADVILSSFGKIEKILGVNN